MVLEDRFRLGWLRKEPVHGKHNRRGARICMRSLRKQLLRTSRGVSASAVWPPVERAWIGTKVLT
jgi:hypothetical protein